MDGYSQISAGVGVSDIDCIDVANNASAFVCSYFIYNYLLQTKGNLGSAFSNLAIDNFYELGVASGAVAVILERASQ